MKSLNVLLLLILMGLYGKTPCSIAAPTQALTFCEKHGGRAELRETAEKTTTTFCRFADGSECEMFAFNNGDCAPAGGELHWLANRPPQFDDYPAEAKAQASSELVNDAETAEQLKIISAAEGVDFLAVLHGQPNFAGHYILTWWSVGTNTLTGAVIDKTSGKVLLDPFWFYTRPGEVGELDFRPDSRLLVLHNGTLDPDAKDFGPHYFVWANGSMLPLRLQHQSIY